MSFLVEHGLVDYINAASTAVVALFTVAMFFVVKYQLQASKDIERAWVMVGLGLDPFAQDEPFLSEKKNMLDGKISSVTTAARLQLALKNDGNGPVWVKQLQARMILVDSENDLPHKPDLTKQDDQHWHPAPFLETDSVRFRLTTNGSRVTKNLLIVYGKIRYLDKFRDEERFSTFGYVIKDDHGNTERLKSHPEYNRNT